MWVSFKAYNENDKLVKTTLRFCESQKHANLVAQAFKNMLIETGKGCDFVAQSFCEFNIIADYEDMKFNIDSLTSYIYSNPCSYGRHNDIGCNRLHQYI